jgi:hypothetical protein
MRGVARPRASLRLDHRSRAALLDDDHRRALGRTSWRQCRLTIIRRLAWTWAWRCRHPPPGFSRVTGIPGVAALPILESFPAPALLGANDRADRVMVEADVAGAGLQQHHAGIEGADLAMQAGASDQEDIDPGSLAPKAIQVRELLVLRYRRKLGITALGVLFLRVCHWSPLSLSAQPASCCAAAVCRPPAGQTGRRHRSMILQCTIRLAQ